jgi:hypothetical protein
MSAQEKKIPLPISEINWHFSLPVLALLLHYWSWKFPENFFAVYRGKDV